MLPFSFPRPTVFWFHLCCLHCKSFNYCHASCDASKVNSRERRKERGGGRERDKEDSLCRLPLVFWLDCWHFGLSWAARCWELRQVATLSRPNASKVLCQFTRWWWAGQGRGRRAWWVSFFINLLELWGLFEGRNEKFPCLVNGTFRTPKNVVNISNLTFDSTVICHMKPFR